MGRWRRLSMNQNIFDNPFTQCTARDMSYAEVIEYWCDPFNPYKIDRNELFRSKTPIFIEGARGSGKTMILKYISYYCQKDIVLSEGGGDILDFFIKQGSLGIYLRYKEDFVNIFSSLSCTNATKKKLFSYYYELLICREMTQIMEDILEASSSTTANKLCLDLCNGYAEYFSKELTNLNQATDYINELIDRLDEWVRNSRYYENSEEELLRQLRPGMVKSIVSIIRDSVPKLRNILFLVIIDEYENAKEYQKDLNTYIKKVDNTENISYRIGMRTEGMFTYDTELGESLQVDRDFLLKRLIFKDIRTFKGFLKVICEKRLQASKFFSAYNITDIELLLGKSEDVEEEALNVVKNSGLGPVEHFNLLKRDISPEEFNRALKELRYPQNPLIEMLNIIWVLRGVSVENTSAQMREYLSGKAKRNSKYARDYIDKYKYQLAFILLNIYKRNQKLKKLYYSFNTFAFLATGSVNDFISLCRNTFYQLDVSYYNRIESHPRISPVLQTNGAAKTAHEQLGKIKANDENGLQMYTYVMNLGNWFSLFHKDPKAKYPETNQFAFENEAEIGLRPSLEQSLKSMLKWGALVKKEGIQSITIGRRKGSVYYLSHIFAPLFNISYRIRGGYNPVLPTELFEKMLNNSMDAGEIERYLTGIKQQRAEKRKSLQKQQNESTYDALQLSLFTEEAENE